MCKNKHMSKYTSTIVIIATVLVAFCQCRQSKSEEADGYGSDYPTKEAFAVIDSCMQFMTTNPQRTHQILDSIGNAKLISPQRCEYLHAMVMLTGENKPDSALIICDRLLGEHDFGEDKFIEEEICDLASNITSSIERHIETLKYAKRGIALCHGNATMRNDEASFMGRIGMAEQMMGHTEKAKETYDNALELLNEDNTFGGLIAKISIMKKQALLLIDTRKYDQAISRYHDILDLVHRFDRDPSIIEQRPETMRESGSATHEFADFYECQIFSNIASSYRMKIEKGLASNANAEADSVKKYVDLWCLTESSKSTENLANAVYDLYFTGREAKYEEAKAAAWESFKNDSLVKGYVGFLTLMAEEAAHKNDYRTSSAFLKRAITISDSIRQKDVLRELSEQMAVNMVQEQQLARQDAENNVRHQRVIIILLTAALVLLVAAGLIITILIRRNRKNIEIIEMTQQDLTETREGIKELAQQLEESKAEKLINSSTALYARIQQAMDEQKLYLNTDLDIKSLAENIASSRTLISVCINSITGKTFRQWLAEYRLSLFIKLMEENPDSSLEELMGQCGYKDQSTFRRQFKTAYGMTPSEYRKQHFPAPSKD